jgi:uncharacterized protein YqgC (DUF456 family)
MLNVTLIIALILFAVVGILLAALQLPGTWLILAAAAGYDWYYGFDRIGWKWLAALAAVAVVAEVADSLFAVAFARRAGASKRAAVGALIGGFAGMFVFSLPLPVIGTIAGGVIGCFAGAFLAEVTHPQSAELDTADRLSSGARVGVGAAIGRIAGLLVKLAAAFVIAGASVALAILH